jgi:hypothetical protein
MSSATTEPTQRYLMMALPFVFVICGSASGRAARLLDHDEPWTVGQQSVIRRKLGHQTGASGDDAAAVRRVGRQRRGAPAPTRKEKKESKESQRPLRWLPDRPHSTAPAATPKKKRSGCRR